MDEEEDDTRYAVVVNADGVFSIWLAHKPVPAGWRREGPEGAKAACLAHIERVWTDMRPRGLRGAANAPEGIA
jgi:MbtH protein